VTRPRTFWMRWRVRAGYPVAVIFWLLASPSPRSILCGGMIVALGLLVRAAAAGHLRKGQELATTGPYAHTRNPLYFGSALLAAGFAVAGNSWPAALLAVVYFAVFYSLVIRDEESGLRERFGASFEAYAARVPPFFPRLTAAHGNERAATQNTFSWALYRRNHEYNAFAGTVGGLAVMALRMWLRMRWGH